MTQILYNLRTSDLGYRITKFTDGEVESSYLTSDQACDCPAGHRTSCRHRQMLPQMLARHLADSDLFWDFDRGFSCDINGNARRETVLAGPHVEEDTAGFGKVMRIKFPPDFKIEQTVDLVVPTGQHTAAEGLPPEQTVERNLAKQRLYAENYQTKPWRRL